MNNIDEYSSYSEQNEIYIFELILIISYIFLY